MVRTSGSLSCKHSPLPQTGYGHGAEQLADKTQDTDKSTFSKSHLLPSHSLPSPHPPSPSTCVYSEAGPNTSRTRDTISTKPIFPAQETARPPNPRVWSDISCSAVGLATTLTSLVIFPHDLTSLPLSSQVPPSTSRTPAGASRAHRQLSISGNGQPCLWPASKPDAVCRHLSSLLESYDALCCLTPFQAVVDGRPARLDVSQDGPGRH